MTSKLKLERNNMVLCDCGCGVHWPVCVTCGGMNQVSALRMSDICASCLEKMVREEEELCERIYKEYMRDNGNADMNNIILDITKREKKLASAVDRSKLIKEKRLCEKLFLHSGKINVHSIPFQGLQEEEIINILLNDVKNKESKIIKMRIKEAIILDLNSFMSFIGTADMNSP